MGLTGSGLGEVVDPGGEVGAMLRRVMPRLGPLIIVVVLVVAGCGGSGDASVSSTVSSVLSAVASSSSIPATVATTAPLSGSVAPGTTAAAPSAIPAPVPPSQLHTEGNKIVDEAGNVVILRGMAIMDPVILSSGCCPQLGPWREDILRTIGEWGATVVRIPLHPPMFFDTGVGNSLEILDQAIEWAAKYDLYVIIDYHGLGFPPDGYNAYDWAATTVEEMIYFWDLVSARYAGNSVVAFYQPYNEPMRDNNRALRLDDWLLWKELSEEVIDKIRVNDPETMIIVSGMKGGNDLSFALQAPIEGDNIVYEAHPFPGSSRWVPWDKAFGWVSEEYPVTVEFGFDNDPAVDEFLWESKYAGSGRYRDEIIEYLEERGLSWTIWVFSHEWPARMLLDEDYTPSELGQFVKDQLSTVAIASANASHTDD